MEHPELELEDRLESLMLDKLDSEFPELDGSGLSLENVEVPYVVSELPRLDSLTVALNELMVTMWAGG